ncbi:MAG: ABC transporter permease [archaeon]
MASKYKELYNLTIKSIFRRKTRSILTILAVVIGIGSVVALVLLSEGLFTSVEKEFNKMGTNRVFVMANYNENPEMLGRLSKENQLTTDDAKLIESVSDIKEVYPYVVNNARVTSKNKDTYVQCIAVPKDKIDSFAKEHSIEINNGSFFNGRNGNFVVIGPRLANGVYNHQIKVGSTIKINDIDFKVIGILKSMGNSDDDSTVVITKEAYDIITNGDSKVVNQISVIVNDGADIDYVAKKIERKLETVHEENTLLVMSAKQVLNQIKKVLDIMKTILIAIACISLVVASIGIVNSVYTSVLERTKEIGVLKSIGAKISDITFIFVLESTVLSIIGGIIGVGLGILIAQSVVWYAHSTGFTMLQIHITISIVILALIISIVVGLIAGLFPARKAAKMNPVDALNNVF